MAQDADDGWTAGVAALTILTFGLGFDGAASLAFAVGATGLLMAARGSWKTLAPLAALSWILALWSLTRSEALPRVPYVEDVVPMVWAVRLARVSVAVLGAGGVDVLAGQREFAQMPVGHDQWKPGQRAHIGDDRELDLTDRELGIGTGITDVDRTDQVDAAADAAEKAEAKARGKGEDEDTVAQKAAEAAERATPRPKAQRNFTDPESKIMLTGDGSFAQCYNGQAVVDAAHQIIVAAEVNDCAADVGNLIPMTEQAISNTGQAPKQMLADAGYCSAANLAASAEVTGEQGTEFFIATGRQRSGEPAPIAPRGPIPASATDKQRMARKLATKKGRAVYARRKAIVEPVFGQMSTLQNGKQLLIRGLDAARGEWLLLAACHNLRKLHGHIGATGLGGLQIA